MGLRALFLGITFGTLSILVVWYHEMQVLFGVQVALFATVFMYLLVPAIFHFSSFVQRHLVFLPYLRWPTGVNFEHPEDEGIPGARNFYFESEPKYHIGVWHILPHSLVEQSKDKDEIFWMQSMKTSKKDIIIYFHGNSGSRAGEHRKELYLLLQNQDYHVVCFDYRGYADSTECAPTETGTVTDGLYVYNWVRNMVGTNKDVSIFIWGHSLGTGVSSHVVAKLCKEGNPPAGLILEAPFTNLGEEVSCHMLTAIYRILPYFDYIFTYPLKKNDMEFQSDRHIASITIPIVILHAVDDPVIPFFLAQKLFKIGYETRPESAKPIYFKDFGEGYAHKYICRSPELNDIVNDFVRSAKTDSWPCKILEGSSFSLIEETTLH